MNEESILEELNQYLQGQYATYFRDTNKIVCRCLVCGDSKKNSRTTRMAIFKGKDSYVVSCRNCEYSTSLRNFIFDYLPDLKERYIEVCYFNTNVKKYEEKKKEKIVYNKTLIDIGLISINSLDKNHDAVKYLESREIPKSMYYRLWYTDNYKEVVKHIYPAQYERLRANEKRIVFPIFDKEKRLIGLSGRAIDKVDKLRYIISKNKLIEEGNQLYTFIEYIDETRPHYVLEGAFDCLFIDNSIAVNTSTLWKYDGNDNTIYIPDRDYHNKDILKVINKLINKNKKIILFPPSINGKDINEMVQNKENINLILHNHVYQGIQAKIRLNELI